MARTYRTFDRLNREMDWRFVIDQKRYPRKDNACVTRDGISATKYNQIVKKMSKKNRRKADKTATQETF